MINNWPFTSHYSSMLFTRLPPDERLLTSLRSLCAQQLTSSSSSLETVFSALYSAGRFQWRNTAAFPRSNDDRPSKIVAPNIVAATAERINIYSGSDGRVKVGSPQRNANTCALANMVTAHAFYEVFNTSRDNAPVVKISASKCPFKLYRISPRNRSRVSRY